MPISAWRGQRQRLINRSQYHSHHHVPSPPFPNPLPAPSARDVPLANIAAHEAVCARQSFYCEACNDVIPAAEKDAHLAAAVRPLPLPRSPSLSQVDVLGVRYKSFNFSKIDLRNFEGGGNTGEPKLTGAELVVRETLHAPKACHPGPFVRVSQSQFFRDVVNIWR